MTTRPSKTKEKIMSAALACTGLLDFFECLEDGKGPLEAATGAYERTKERGQAIQKAARQMKRKRRPHENE